MAVDNNVRPLRGWKRLVLETASKVPYGQGVRALSLLLNNPLGQRLLVRKRRFYLARMIHALGVSAGVDQAATRNVLCNDALPWVVNALSRCDEAGFRRWVTVEGEPVLDAAKAQDKGLLVVNCHSGVSRLVPLLLMLKWGDVYAMEPEAWLSRMGVPGGAQVHSITMRGDGEKFWLRQIFQANRVMAEKKTMHVAMDGLQGTGGKERNFLGRKRVFHVGLAQMAIARGTPIIQVLTRIDETGRVSIRYRDPLAGAGADLNEEARLGYFLDNYLSALEALWLEDPGNIAVRHLRHYLTSEPIPPEKGIASKNREEEPENV